MNFDQLDLSKDVLRGVEATGYTTPTPIQQAAIPVILDGKDLIGCAQTGTGKTAAFVLPLLDRLAASPRTQGPRRVRALVVTPTRELALQVDEAVRTYGKFTPFRSLPIYGGVGMSPQFQGLRRGADIIVATPGRLIDHLERGSISLSHCEVLVLDEADRMLDMGFIHDVRKIVAATPRKRQTLLFSATMHGPVRQLADSILQQPEFIEIGHRRNPADTVEQAACLIDEAAKIDLLYHVLETEDVNNMIVFSRTKHRADRITRRLNQEGFSAVAIHSNRSQAQRQKALQGFKLGRFRVLVATDIAARGIDVEGITHVINFDTPNLPESYIHRIGRTGRAEATGRAITFVTRDEMAYLRQIESYTGHKIERIAYAPFADRQYDEPRRHEQQHAPERAARGHQKAGNGPQRRNNNRRSGARPKNR
ncbi:MAG: DEAD/DEAH box helicase [Rhodothermales bacterium]